MTARIRTAPSNARCRDCGAFLGPRGGCPAKGAHPGKRAAAAMDRAIWSAILAQALEGGKR